MNSMFALSIKNDKTIEVSENGNLHEIPLSMTHWNTNDLLCHWGYELKGLINGYSVKYLFLNMVEERGQGFVRVFRAVRTRNHINFDDMRTAVPWRVRSWNPMECIEYALSSRGLSRIDYGFSSLDRIHDFTLSVDGVGNYLYSDLEHKMPENHVSEFKLYYSVSNT